MDSITQNAELEASLITEETIKASVAAEDALAAAFADVKPLSVIIADSEKLGAKLQGLGVERYYDGAIGVSAIAGATLSALRCCYVEDGIAHLLSSDDVEHASCFAGLSLNAAQEDGDITLMASGVLEDASWSWEANKPLFIGADGRLTQTPPETGFSQNVATPVSTTKIIINPQESILL